MEPNLAKVGVEGSNPFARSNFLREINGLQNSRFPKCNFKLSLDYAGISVKTRPAMNLAV